MSTTENAVREDSVIGSFIAAPAAAPKPVVKIFDYILSKDTSDYFIIIANKATKVMYLLQRQSAAWRVIREFSIAIGEQEGRKVTAGDKRTPEGLYCIVGRKEKNELAAIYGPLAYVLDYPNEDDRRAGRTGQGIWIHGTAPDSLPFQTRGCLEMENKNLQELSSLLKKGIGTPVLIVSDPKLSDIASVLDMTPIQMRHEQVVLAATKVESEFTEQFRQLLTSWKTAWETRDIGRYETFYDTVRFSGQGLRWGGWKERKLRTFSLYDTIAISIDRMMVVKESENKMIVKFLQKYTTNLNSIENGKKIWFEKVNEYWKITGESTCSKEELLL